MRVFFNTSEAAGLISNAVVTTGSFDGVHIGHKLIIRRLNQIAKDIQGESVLITFHPHPRKVLYPEQKDLKLINTQEEKIELLKKTHLDNLIIIPFTIEFSKTTSHDFITDILVGQLGARVVVVGHNHHFGHNRQGDYSYLHALSRQHGFSVEEIPLQDIENETVSSTKIRKALFEGNIQRANAYLDHQYILNGSLSESVLQGGLAGTHVVEIVSPETEKLIPPAGLFATNLCIEGRWHKGLTMVSRNTDETARVLTYLLYDPFNAATTQGTLYFYKKIMDHDLLVCPDSRLFEQAREMVDDLIY